MTQKAAALPKEDGGTLAANLWLATKRIVPLLGMWLAVPLALAIPQHSNVLTGVDTHAYWALDGANPYRIHVAPMGDAYLYSPATVPFADALGAVPYDVLVVAWRLMQAVLLMWMAGPLAGLLCLLPPVAYELTHGNISIPIGAAIVAGMRSPGFWAFPLLTKATPGIGVLWFASRREWRRLAIAVGVTAAVCVPSLILRPDLWAQWIGVLSENTAVAGDVLTPVPLAVRLPLAAALVWVGARRDWRWIVPIACVLALGHIWVSTLAILVAVIPLIRPSREQEASNAVLVR